MMVHRRLIALAGRIAGALAVTIAINLVIAATWLAQAFATAVILRRIFGGGSFDDVVVPLLTIIVLIVCRAGLTYAKEISVQRTAAAVKTRIRRRLLDKLQQLGPGYLINVRAGHAQATVVDGVENLEAYYGQYLPQLVTVIVTTLGVVGYMFSIDWAVAASLLVVALLIPTLPRLWDRLLRRSGDTHWKAFEELNADYVDAMQGMTTLKTFNAADGRRRVLNRKAWRIYVTGKRVNLVSMIDGGITAFGQGLGAALAVGVGAWRVTHGALALDDLFVVLLLGAETFRPFRELTLYWHAGYLGYSAAGAIEELLEAPVEISERPDAIVLRLDMPPTVRFYQVSFTYKERERPALDSVDIVAEAGRTLAIVGRSGSGKSTIVSLLQRFFDPQQGTITIDGTDITSFTLSSLRDNIAVVSQDTYLFHGTIAENLRLAAPSATSDQLVLAATAANMHGFVAQLPDGYETMVGERGLTLSGGQRQRVAIARALLKNAPILVLDEATASMDAANELEIVDALARATVGRTVIVIAHRLNTIRAADRIVVLADGAAVQNGDHDTLVRLDGTYQRLVRAQGDTA